MVYAHEKSGRNENLKRMLAPRLVAIIGASFKEDKAGYKAVKAFDRFEGDVWPVNPQGGEILGRRFIRARRTVSRFVCEDRGTARKGVARRFSRRVRRLINVR